MFANKRRAAPPTVPGFTLVTRPLGTMPAYFLSVVREHGTFVRFRNPLRNVYLIAEPPYVEEVLVAHGPAFMKGRGTQRLKRVLGNGLLTSEQPRHLRNRRLLQPAFHRKRIDAYAAIMVDATRERVARWSEGDTIEIDREANGLALEIVAKAVFGADLSREMGAIADALNVALGTFPASMRPFSELFDRFPLPANVRLKRAKSRLDAIVDRMIAEHRAGGGDTGDLLTMLLDAGPEMNDLAIRDEVLTILLAGHETTANAIAWSFYLLQRHPEVEAKLHRQLDEVLGERDADAGDVPALDYVRAVFAEAMRLYPPVWVTARRALRPVRIGPYEIARGDIAIVSQYVSHRDPRFFAEPERFRPERWLEDSPPPKFAYFPFGGGTRVCIGEAFAWMEGILALATIARRVRLLQVDAADVAPLPLVTLRPQTRIRGRVSARTPQSHARVRG